MSIYPERSKGKPTGLFVVEVTQEGKRHRARVSTMSEARQVERDMKRGKWQVAAPEAPKSDLLTLQGLLDKAKLKGFKRDQKRGDRSLLEIEWCLGHLGPHMPVESVSKESLESIRDARLKMGNKPTTADRYMAALSSLLHWGRDHDLVVRQPSVPYSGITNRRRAWLTVEQEVAIVQRMIDNGHVDEAICVVAMAQTGMRKGELLDIEIGQIDVRSGLITLLDQKDGTGAEGLPIDPELAEKLREVFLRGRPTYMSLRGRFKAAARACGHQVDQRDADGKPSLDNVVLHSLRHSTATRLILSGESPAVVQEYMRHKSWNTTRGYLKLTGQPKRKALERLTVSGQNLRGILSPQVATNSNGLENIEENQEVGAQGRNRTTDTAIFSRDQKVNDHNE